jgi:hypothetical protein
LGKQVATRETGLTKAGLRSMLSSVFLRFVQIFGGKNSAFKKNAIIIFDAA